MLDALLWYMSLAAGVNRCCVESNEHPCVPAMMRLVVKVGCGAEP